LLKARFANSGKACALIQQGFLVEIFVTMAGEMDFRAAENIPKFGVSVAVRA